MSEAFSRFCDEMVTSSLGVSRRLARLSRDDVYLLLAADHGLSLGPQPGLGSPPEVASVVASVAVAGATGVVVNYGMTRYVADSVLPLIVQTMGAPQMHRGTRRPVVVTPKQAIAVGADAVAVQIDFRDAELSQSLTEVAGVLRDAHELGLPVLAMVTGDSWESTAEHLAAIRWVTELGVDLVKIAPGDLAAGPPIDVRPADIPVLLAGGLQSRSAEALLTWAGKSGYSGFCLGRNVFGEQNSRERFVRLTDAFYAGRM
jgi:DhnA family fructose-bisphosphate aldolase class Ia